MLAFNIFQISTTCEDPSHGHDMNNFIAAFDWYVQTHLLMLVKVSLSLFLFLSHSLSFSFSLFSLSLSLSLSLYIYIYIYIYSFKTIYTIFQTQPE